MSEEIVGPPCLQCAEPMHFAKVARQGRGDAHFLRCLRCPVTVILTRAGYDEIRAIFDDHAGSNVVVHEDNEAVINTTSAPPLSYVAAQSTTNVVRHSRPRAVDRLEKVKDRLRLKVRSQINDRS